MKRYKIAFAVLALFIVLAACIFPVSANIISDYTTDYDASTQKVHVEITLTGGSEGAPASEYPRDIVFLIDVSTSMRKKYENKTRLDWAKEAIINNFLPYPYNNKVGVVTFSDEVSTISPLTLDLEGVKSKIDTISCHGLSTTLLEAISQATKVLKERERAESLPIIILLTDGGFEKEGLKEIHSVKLVL